MGGVRSVMHPWAPAAPRAPSLTTSFPPFSSALTPSQVVFNPKDTNTFASASLDRTIKVRTLIAARG